MKLKRSNPEGKIRIIGGSHRGRKIAVPSVLGLRPTPDRIRETLFNWLAPYISGSHCLDLFAGSGALSFEALSRGAAGVTAVDSHQTVISHLNTTAKSLKVDDELEILRSRLPSPLHPRMKPFNIVFLDPPYDQDLLRPCMTWLDECGLLGAQCWIYMEHNADIPEQGLPPNWQCVKAKKAGQVHYYLILREE